MVVKRVTSLLLFFNLILTNLQSQDVLPLKVGDRISDCEFNLLNYKTSKARLSDFKNKYIILDFWATWCRACIKKFPELDSLQSNFEDEDLQIILVNSVGSGDDIQRISSFFNSQKKTIGKSYSLPTIFNDSVLEKYFPHRSVPHYVMIDRDGRVQAITSSDQINTENIRSFVGGKKLNLPLKEENLEFDKKKPLFKDRNGGDYDRSIYSSFLTGHLEGLPVTEGYDKNNSKLITRHYSINNSILGLYRSAYRELFTKYENRVILNVKNSHKYEYSKRYKWDEWKFDNSYSYEQIIPPSTSKEVKTYMQNDLMKYFGLKVYTEVRSIKHLVVARIDNGNVLLEIPMIYKSDEFWGRISFDLSGYSMIYNREKLNKALQEVGFILSEVQKEIECLVISE